ncbi:hypothetical protein GE21DRAFT_6949 [Neurospora crassa]|uniref:Uncharacterized protein n=1 Tax=Neurospora crassa (strain ATCC 24698 / 74-OR23-1A / CBS 708.71 / DSM 1257 / FGSC 987) TaxID=367110 RepID=V5INM9_NEUCR|nr:hypothetical protein NCU16926 [Neurospora crassa OR74A]ESA42366.1 hypothetical protein NCU16926 [Neurospora crassa OR74A]KHE83883.1 hypothetical protein GE21DRAFT_6949 [Neurospora crassa]|eukprot:XP_011394806.1 hypothetical protein NCU16926 [Neurospora crassa OR74A]
MRTDPCPGASHPSTLAGHSALGGEPRVKEGRSRASSHGYVRSQLVTSSVFQRKAKPSLCQQKVQSASVSLPAPKPSKGESQSLVVVDDGAILYYPPAQLGSGVRPSPALI